MNGMFSSIAQTCYVDVDLVITHTFSRSVTVVYPLLHPMAGSLYCKSLRISVKLESARRILTVYSK